MTTSLEAATTAVINAGAWPLPEESIEEFAERIATAVLAANDSVITRDRADLAAVIDPAAFDETFPHSIRPAEKPLRRKAAFDLADTILTSDWFTQYNEEVWDEGYEGGWGDYADANGKGGPGRGATVNPYRHD